MASNLACVGLAVRDQQELQQLIGRMRPLGLLGREGGVEAVRWEDTSGARLAMTLSDGRIAGYLPSFAGRSVSSLGAVKRLNDDVSSADVFDEDGNQSTALTLELEERGALGNAVVSGRARLVALGSHVTVFANAEEFARSPASLLDPNADQTSEPPPHFVANGWPWPPRMGATSFISFGTFEAPEAATANARLNGVVINSQRRANGLTGQDFIVARVATVFDADVCLAADEHPEVPSRGAVIAGTVFMVGSLDEWSTDVVERLS